MNSVDYTPNSHKYKAEQKQAATDNKQVDRKPVEKAVKGTVTRKKNEVRKFTDILAPGDVKNITDYIVWEMLIPSGKKMLSEMGRVFLDMLLYGDSGRGGDRRGSSYDRVSYHDYGRYSSSDRNAPRASARVRTPYDYEDIEFDDRYDAVEVLRRMDEIMDAYHMVTVAAYYELCGIRDNNYMNYDYGWTSIRTAEIVPSRGKWVIKLPKVMSLK
ncbi:MAG: hypothetical protein IKZ08_02610 [Bacteroidales bacterium]|nr:hypothetical protein [Bacteroidales bacterium]